MRTRVAAARRLFSAVCFLMAGIFNIINLLVFDTRLNPVSLALEALWCIAWFITSIHQLVYRSIMMTRTIQQPDTQPFIPAHTLTKGALITATASSALAMDGYRLQNGSTAQILRTFGSIMWVGIGALEITMARRHEYRAAKHPNEIIRVCKVKPSVYYALHACMYLTVGTVYAAALWGNGDNAPQNTVPELAWIRPIPNLCWLIAGINEVTRTLENAIKDNVVVEEVETEDTEVVEPAPAPPPPTEPDIEAPNLQC